MGLAEQLDLAVIRALKAVRLEGEEEPKAWEKYVVFPFQEKIMELALPWLKFIDKLLHLLMAIHKGNWDRDTYVRNFPGPYLGNEKEMALIGMMAIDSRDFNHLRTRVVDLLKIALGEDDADPNVNDGRLK